mmetsp:Transcript_14967/g.14557  ORF Transcript_14967/g.14557 Transcript_14967/m.14557 type:complete len:90 (+) Transcript_14967:430-699(+)
MQIDEKSNETVPPVIVEESSSDENKRLSNCYQNGADLKGMSGYEKFKLINQKRPMTSYKSNKCNNLHQKGDSYNSFIPVDVSRYHTLAR